MKVIFKYALVAAVLGIAASCKVSHPVAGELVDMPTRFVADTSPDTASIADIGWQEFFTDTELRDLIRRGVDYNYDLKTALSRISSAHARLSQARLLQLPALGFGVSAQATNPSNNSLNGISLSSFLGQSHIEDYSAAFNLSWEADIWGKIRLRKEGALAAYLQTYEAAKAVQTQVVASIAQGYYNLLMLDDQLIVARNNLMLCDTILNFTRLQWNAGLVSSLSVQQAEAQQKAVAQLVPQLELAIGIQEHALSILTGNMPGHISRKRHLLDVVVADSFASGVPAGLLQRRPDVRTQEMAFRAASAALGVAEREMYPSLTITANAGVNSFKASNWFNLPASLFGSVLGGLTQPVFQRGLLRMNRNLAKQQQEQALFSFRQAVLNAVAEVSNTLLQQKKLREESIIVSDRVHTLDAAVRNAQLLFNSGMANYLEVITVQGNALQAEMQQIQLRRQELAATVDLYRALGGGWK